MQPRVPSGWRNARLPSQHTSLLHGHQSIDIRYRWQRNGSFDLGDGSGARVHQWSERDIDLEVDGQRARCRVTYDGDRLYVQVTKGTADFRLVPRFDVRRGEATPGGLHAPMPGVILDIRVGVGQRVELGQTLVIMEAMKMEHVISAPRTGTVREVLVSAGQQVDNGTELLALDDE